MSIDCKYCWQDFSNTPYTEIARDVHQKKCERNDQNPQNVLNRFVIKCQQQAKIFDCLNCKQFQKTCKWAKNK